MTNGLRFYLCGTKLGWLGLVISPRGLRATTPPLASREEALRRVVEMGAGGPAAEAEAGDLARHVRACVERQGQQVGRHSAPARLDGAIDWDGVSPFRRAVLEETLHIPAGETRSYGWLARRVGRPGAARAVGRAMATNPWPLLIPCHRVVAGDGSLGGYGGGLDMKTALLRAEGERRLSSRVVSTG